MKRMKKIASLLLALVMVIAMGIPAMAAPDYKITVTNDKDHVSIAGNTYTAYKVFSATYNEETDTIAYTYDDTCLTIPEYNGMNAEGILAWLGETKKEGETTVSARTAEEVRDFADFVYENCIKDKSPAGTSAIVPEGAETVDINVREAGYYLVFGTANNIDGSDTITAAVSLTSAHPTENITPKLDAPSLDKQIKHNELTGDGAWGVVGDNQIGDTVEFRTISSVPDINGYDTYTYKIHDTMSESLDFDETSVKILIDNDESKPLNKEFYTVQVTDAHSFTISVDIKGAIAAGLTTQNKLYTYYNATLNGTALVYDEGSQNNAAYLEYSNNPYESSTGKTEEKKVYDWTFKMGVNKVSDQGVDLAGAKFVLSKTDGLTVTIDENGNLSSTDNLIGLTVENGVYTVAGKGVTAPVYVIEAGTTTIKGLDDETTYYLYEVEAPDGYNMLSAPIEFKITADTATYGDDGSQQPTVNATIKQGEDEKTGQELLATIVNKAGVVLPSTGGIGTTIFYVAGGILVLGAVIALITKKRMGGK